MGAGSGILIAFLKNLVHALPFQKIQALLVNWPFG